jgi:hypothetical protein
VDAPGRRLRRVVARSGRRVGVRRDDGPATVHCHVRRVAARPRRCQRPRSLAPADGSHGVVTAPRRRCARRRFLGRIGRRSRPRDGLDPLAVSHRRSSEGRCGVRERRRVRRLVRRPALRARRSERPRALGGDGCRCWLLRDAGGRRRARVRVVDRRRCARVRRRDRSRALATEDRPICVRGGSGRGRPRLLWLVRPSAVRALSRERQGAVDLQRSGTDLGSADRARSRRLLLHVRILLAARVERRGATHVRGARRRRTRTLDLSRRRVQSRRQRRVARLLRRLRSGLRDGDAPSTPQSSPQRP